MSDPHRPIWCLMPSGRAVDLTRLTAADIHWPDLVESLVKIPRFNGATPHVTLTVAQHCCLMHDFADAAHRRIALLDQFHVAFLGEPTWSAIRYLARLSGDPDAFRSTLRLARDELSAPIFAAAGVPDPKDQDALHREQALLAMLDRKLLATERRDVMPACPAKMDWQLPEPFPTPIKPWGQDKARAELAKRLAGLGLDGRL